MSEQIKDGGQAAEYTSAFNQWWDAHRASHAVNGSMKGLAISAWMASRTAAISSAERAQVVAWETLGANGEWQRITEMEFAILQLEGLGRQRKLYAEPILSALEAKS